MVLACIYSSEISNLIGRNQAILSPHVYEGLEVFGYGRIKEFRSIAAIEAVWPIFYEHRDPTCKCIRSRGKDLALVTLNVNPY